MKKLTAAFIALILILLPVLAWADITTRYESGHFTCSGTSAVVFQFATPVPAGATRIKGQGRSLRLFNETAGTTIYCNPNVDSTLAAPAVASDATKNQIKLDDLSPERTLEGFNPQKLQCIGAGAVLTWEIEEL